MTNIYWFRQGALFSTVVRICNFLVLSPNKLKNPNLTDLVPVPGVVRVDDGGRGRPEGSVDPFVELAHLSDRPHPQVEEDVLEESLLLVFQLCEEEEESVSEWSSQISDTLHSILSPCNLYYSRFRLKVRGFVKWKWKQANWTINRHILLILL